jgi:hypothetical protein
MACARAGCPRSESVCPARMPRCVSVSFVLFIYQLSRDGGESLFEDAGDG